MNYKKEIERIANKVSEENLKKLPQTAETLIRKSFLSLLGLNEGVHRTEIDHCNGRWNLLADVLKIEAKNQVSEIIKDMVNQLVFTKMHKI